MRPRVLVVTTVHSADDTRIRERLIRTLSMDWDIDYATRYPGPTDMRLLNWVPLQGGRLRRQFSALRVLLRRSWEVAVVHDPELIPAGVVAKILKKRPVVFDVHEDLPAQVITKDWIPRVLRPVVARFSGWLYGLAERFLDLTLAEDGYSKLFDGSPPVFPNYPRAQEWPAPITAGNGTAIYVGDVQEQRGLQEAIEACGATSRPLVVVGPVAPSFQLTLEGIASECDADVSFMGRLPNPAAIECMSKASVGLSPLRPVPNYVDSFPTKTLEYLAAGIPVVATNLPGTEHALGSLTAVWLVEPGDVSAMAMAIDIAVEATSKQSAVEQVERIRTELGWPEQEVRAFYLNLLSP